MREIGVRELKTTLSAVLRSVSRGEPVRVTSRGSPVADIVPPEPTRQDSRIEALIGAGRIASPVKSRPVRAPRLAQAGQSASALVLAERDAER